MHVEIIKADLLERVSGCRFAEEARNAADAAVAGDVTYKLEFCERKLSGRPCAVAALCEVKGVKVDFRDILRSYLRRGRLPEGEKVSQYLIDETGFPQCPNDQEK